MHRKHVRYDTLTTDNNTDERRNNILEIEIGLSVNVTCLSVVQVTRVLWTKTFWDSTILLYWSPHP